MLNAIRLFLVLAMLAVAAPAIVHAAATPETPAAEKSSVTVDEDSLKKLITTLESETARTDLVGNLKTLLDQQQQEGETETIAEELEPLSKALGVDSFTQRQIQRYESFLERNNLNSSTVGKIALTGIITLIGIGLILFLRRAATRALYWFDRAVEWIDLPARRLRLYTRILRGIITLALVALTVYAYTLIWDYHGASNIFETEWFRRLAGLFINVVFVAFLGVIVWEAIMAMLQLALKRADGGNAARVNTVLPLLRNMLFIVFALLFTLVLLSELGINILPLLAGAGILGIAIGFGAQTIVKDFLTGFTIILEDVVRVGDSVRMAGLSGSVEQITLRKIQLRNYAGTVFTIPYSEIRTIENMTKDFSFYEMDVPVSYEEDPDTVFAIMRDVAAGMRGETPYRNTMLADIEIAGVDRFLDSWLTVKARLKTLPGQQWGVGREFNRRLKKAFDANNVDIPVPQQVSWQINSSEDRKSEKPEKPDKAD